MHRDGERIVLDDDEAIISGLPESFLLASAGNYAIRLDQETDAILEKAALAAASPFGYYKSWAHTLSGLGVRLSQMTLQLQQLTAEHTVEQITDYLTDQ